MRDLGPSAGSSSAAMPGLHADLPSVAEVQQWTQRLAGHGDGLDDMTRIDLIRAVEELKCAAEGAQAELTADFDHSQRQLAADRGVPAERRSRGNASQIAFARRESPHQGQRHLGLAKILRTELPHTRNALRTGRITEWAAMTVAKETACLSLEHRMLIDEHLAADPDVIEAMGHRQLAAAIGQYAAELDPGALAKRRANAESDRHTTLRPAPDTMTWLGALLPVKDGVAVHKALLDEANRAKAAGDPRSRGAIMVDTLVQRVLSPHVANAATATVPLTINVVVPDTVLLGDGEAGGWVEGYGDAPGDLLREWIAEHAENGVMDWVHRLYAKPATGELVGMDKKGRFFDGALGDYLRLRDRYCRNPWCNAPIRHLDHPEDSAKGGPSSAENAQGLCETCNHAKQADDWTVTTVPGQRHTVITTTPTGHRYISVAPATGPPEHTRPSD